MKIQFNRIITIITLAATTGVLTSCDSLFRDAPLNKISEKSVWGNPQLLDEYESSWYRNMSNGFDTYVGTISLMKSKSRYFMPWFGDQITVGKTATFLEAMAISSKAMKSKSPTGQVLHGANTLHRFSPSTLCWRT